MLILLRFGQRNESGLAALLQSVVLTADVDGGGVMLHSVEDAMAMIGSPKIERHSP